MMRARTTALWLATTLILACQSQSGGTPEKTPEPTKPPLTTDTAAVLASSDTVAVAVDTTPPLRSAADVAKTVGSCAPPLVGKGEAGKEVWCETEKGVKEGPYTSWYAGGAQLKEQATFKAGRRVGIYKKWWKDGTPRLDGEYDDEGEGIGVWKVWHENGGELRKTEEFEKGLRHGPFKILDETGELVEMGVYHKGKKRVFIASGGPYLLTASGRKLERVRFGQEERELHFEADGKIVAFARTETGDFGLSLDLPDGSRSHITWRPGNEPVVWPAPPTKLGKHTYDRTGKSYPKRAGKVLRVDAEGHLGLPIVFSLKESFLVPYDNEKSRKVEMEYTVGHLRFDVVEKTLTPVEARENRVRERVGRGIVEAGKGICSVPGMMFVETYTLESEYADKKETGFYKADDKGAPTTLVHAFDDTAFGDSVVTGVGCQRKDRFFLVGHDSGTNVWTQDLVAFEAAGEGLKQVHKINVSGYTDQVPRPVEYHIQLTSDGRFAVYSVSSTKTAFDPLDGTPAHDVELEYDAFVYIP